MHADTSSWPTEAELNWTPRQLEVIEFIAKGYTNAQIAERLDISLAGAKWHVSEVLSKLGVESREAIPDYWHARRGLGARLRKAFAVSMPTLPVGPALAAAAVGVMALASVTIIAARPGDGPSSAERLAVAPTPTPLPSPIEVAYRSMHELAAVTSWSPDPTRQPLPVGAFVATVLESVTYEGVPAYRVVLEGEFAAIPDAPFPVSFEAIVASSNGETLFREFGPLLATGMPSAQPLGPHYPVAATMSPAGDLVLLRIVPSADGNWNVSIPGTVDPSMPSVSYVTTLGAGYGRDDPGQMSAGCSASWCVGQVPDSVAAIRATLEDGRVVFGTLGTPPEGIEFGGQAFIVATDGAWPSTVEALGADGTVLFVHDSSNHPTDPPR